MVEERGELGDSKPDVWRRKSDTVTVEIRRRRGPSPRHHLTGSVLLCFISTAVIVV